MSAVVSEIMTNSLAAKAGIMPGDIIISVNNKSLRDVIDYQLAVEEHQLEFMIERDGEARSITLSRDTSESVGVKFLSSVFDGLWTCQNNCIFCFLDQMPKGFRKSLYVKDDDYRLSFLYGNFITLTNIDQEDIQRIIEQRLSPLYVSLHSTQTEVRNKIFQRRENNALIHLRTLLKAGILIHIQIVLCPGINDGKNLETTIDTLQNDFPEVKSIGIVPVGLSRFRKNLFLVRLFTSSECSGLIEQISKMQQRFKKGRGTSWIFLADEFYLNADECLPSYDHYEDFAQLENGIGISRMFLQGIQESLREVNSCCLQQEDTFNVITGKLAYPLLRDTFRSIQAKLGGNFHVLAVPSRSFGETITVAGLVTGKDIINYLKPRKISGTLVIPEVMLNPENRFLDDVSVRNIAQALEMKVLSVPVDGSLPFKKLSTKGGCLT